ncbi:hypothetical protein QD47_12940 [Paenibacillus terrae]|uniref:Uncharacterized protein n=1 Tax=Paenibacillus terrae TaxID=159743 RepID=A0A0D7X179_9BACL|nr:hypothetical protein QD47_12940 [Paenibacillus terrae]
MGFNTYFNIIARTIKKCKAFLVFFMIDWKKNRIRLYERSRAANCLSTGGVELAIQLVAFGISLVFTDIVDNAHWPT